jgi:hypothetical protein
MAQGVDSMSYEKQGKLFKGIVYDITAGISLGIFITVYLTGGF